MGTIMARDQNRMKVLEGNLFQGCCRAMHLTALIKHLTSAIGADLLDVDAKDDAALLSHFLSIVLPIWMLPLRLSVPVDQQIHGLG